eukprot:4051382-Amphidinium_carterae.1
MSDQTVSAQGTIHSEPPRLVLSRNHHECDNLTTIHAPTSKMHVNDYKRNGRGSQQQTVAVGGRSHTFSPTCDKVALTNQTQSSSGDCKSRLHSPCTSNSSHAVIYKLQTTIRRRLKLYNIVRIQETQAVLPRNCNCNPDTTRIMGILGGHMVAISGSISWEVLE